MIAAIYIAIGLVVGAACGLGLGRLFEAASIERMLRRYDAGRPR